MSKDIIRCTSNVLSSRIISTDDALGIVSQCVLRLTPKKGSVCIVSDKTCFASAGAKINMLLTEENIAVSLAIFDDEPLSVDQVTLYRLVNILKKDIIIIAIGGNTINKLSSLAAAAADLRYILVPTAPNIDSYYGNTMRLGDTVISGSIPSIILADSGVMASAPMQTLKSGIIKANNIKYCAGDTVELITSSEGTRAILNREKHAILNLFIALANTSMEKQEK